MDPLKKNECNSTETFSPKPPFLENVLQQDNCSLHKTFQTKFQEQLNEKSTPFPSCLYSVAPKQVERWRQLDKIEAVLNDAILVQKSLLQKSLSLFDNPLRPSQLKQEGTNLGTLRLYVYNTFFNQKNTHMELNNFSPCSTADCGLARWVLHIQGTLLNVDRNQLQASGTLLPRMTSFFDRIMITRQTETLIWDRTIQPPQPQCDFLQEKSTRPCSQKRTETLSNKHKTPIVSKECVVNENATGTALNDSVTRIPDRHSDEELEVLINASISDQVTRCLVDCDGIELNRCGDVEEDILITLFPSSTSRLFCYSSELQAITNFPVGTLCDAVHSIWRRSRISLRHCTNLKTFWCDDQVKAVLKCSENTYDIYQLPQLLEPHLKPVAPIELKHTIKLTGDYIDNENVYDIQVDLSHSLLTPEHVSDTSYLKNLSSVTITPAVCENTDKTFSKEPQVSSDMNPCTMNVPTDTKMAEIWSSLLNAVKRRNLLLQFAENPHKFMHHILTHPYEDTQESFLEMYELADTKNEYYSQPWVAHAVQSYLENRKKNFADVINDTVAIQPTTTGYGEGVRECDKKTEEAFFSFPPSTTNDTGKKKFETTTRVPVFSHVENANRMNPYNYPVVSNQFNRYLPQFNPFLPSNYPMQLDTMNPFSVYKSLQGFPNRFRPTAYPPPTTLFTPNPSTLSHFTQSHAPPL
ncbi:uncharacterized protein LOC128883388 isoform X2 [Hylaeus volcanicus]|uniref:uncharacterized protein LOC128883388 isoform X2 n=1 Tax=Hylaeus volcanicus TaxID=313075 RepID=UPI0023B8620D|nr:uncharacterized protein LOC128883388 isoform X2 [Hylaeus volcanicus]